MISHPSAGVDAPELGLIQHLSIQSMGRRTPRATLLLHAWIAGSDWSLDQQPPTSP
jgi:hypothetical protein